MKREIVLLFQMKQDASELKVPDRGVWISFNSLGQNLQENEELKLKILVVVRDLCIQKLHKISSLL